MRYVCITAYDDSLSDVVCTSLPPSSSSSSALSLRPSSRCALLIALVTRTHRARAHARAREMQTRPPPPHPASSLPPPRGLEDSTNPATCPLLSLALLIHLRRTENHRPLSVALLPALAFDASERATHETSQNPFDDQMTSSDVGRQDNNGELTQQYRGIMA